MTFKCRIGWLLVFGLAAVSTASHAATGPRPLVPPPHEGDGAANAATFKLAQAQSAAPTTPAPTPATPAASGAAASVGSVVSVQGNATATRNGATSALKSNDEIFKGDTLKTSANSALGVIFDDETTFNLRANASITVDDFVYQEGGNRNKAAINVLAGTVAFVASAVAKTGDMTISTPVSTTGIRGTTGLVEVGPSASGAATDNIKLYPDADGRVGRIEIRGRDGTALGVLTRAASGFAIRGGAGLRPTAMALQISPQQAARDQTIVRQTHQAQSAGRPIAAQRRQRQPGAVSPRQQRPQQLRPQQPRLQQPAIPQQPGRPNPNLPKQNLRTQTPTGPGLPQQQRLRTPQPQPPQPALQPRQQPRLQTPQLQPRPPALQPQRGRLAPRLAVPPGRRPAAAPPQKKRKPQ